ncbi:MAG: type II toxin-antitoxin system VapC family toxin [Roseiarcus sp.]
MDTHAFLWWLAGDRKLSVGARKAIGEDTGPVFVSAASVWEISAKHRSGKLPGASAIVGDLAEAIESQGFVGMPIAIRHAQAAGALPGPHRDPFDRMLIAQAILDDLVLLSNERAFDAYGVRRLW